MENTKYPEKVANSLNALALKALLDAGALCECTFHRGAYFSGPKDVTLTYRIASNRVLAGNIELPAEFDIGEFVAAMRTVYSANSLRNSCESCEEGEFGGHS